jgi:hypothetical protein
MLGNNYGDGSEDVSDCCILYELLMYCEWMQDPELLVIHFKC